MYGVWYCLGLSLRVPIVCLPEPLHSTPCYFCFHFLCIFSHVTRINGVHFLFIYFSRNISKLLCYNASAMNLATSAKNCDVTDPKTHYKSDRYEVVCACDSLNQSHLAEYEKNCYEIDLRKPCAVLNATSGLVTAVCFISQGDTWPFHRALYCYNDLIKYS